MNLLHYLQNGLNETHSMFPDIVSNLSTFEQLFAPIYGKTIYSIIIYGTMIYGAAKFYYFGYKKGIKNVICFYIFMFCIFKLLVNGGKLERILSRESAIVVLL